MLFIILIFKRSGTYIPNNILRTECTANDEKGEYNLIYINHYICVVTLSRSSTVVVCALQLKRC